MLKIWSLLVLVVMLSHLLQMINLNGAFVESAVQCQQKKNKCCGKARCITSFVTFHNTCTDREVLVLAIRARCDIRVDDPDYSTNSYRKAAYRQYILWRYKKLGRGNRRVCPSCVVLTIRHIYPANDGTYMGFRRA